MSSELDKTFDPAAIEAKWYAHWEDNGLFRPDRPDAVPFTIVNPPPNVTGSLHIGHALDNTLQDVVIRYERLRGKDALWVVGMDHAGIATQMVVERQLEAQQDKRTNYSREQFVDKIWQWKAESGGAITGQLRRLGCSMDWSREQFTMDPHFTRAVLKVFVDLYHNKDEDGNPAPLIYRDKRLVNWDPKLKTAISDLEVETQEIKGGFWHFKYPLADGVRLDSGADHIVVATTRPETMLADMAVAVNAEDPRYQSVIGKDILQPLTGRRFKVIADEHADPELGSGAVKITPGHDFNDFEVGKRAGIKPGEMLNMFDVEAKVVQTTDGLIPDEFLGLDRFDARKLVVERMKQAGFLVPHIVTSENGDVTEHDAEPRVVATPFGDRGGVVIEPWLTDQWYVDAATLAGPAMDAVRSGAIEIVPKSWEKTFFNWMENIQPWCVSRQLWWGHRIPAWYGPVLDEEGTSTYLSDMSKNQVFVDQDWDSVLVQLQAYYGNDRKFVITSTWADFVGRNVENLSIKIKDHESRSNEIVLLRDEDVLDTWFSSALWPFATLGWPEENPSPLAGEGGAPSGAEGEGSAAQAAAGAADPSPNPLPQGERASLLARHYPNDLLISGFDILFFWDARMAMQGIHFMQDVPWKRLYLHGLVRAPDGQKMSKSKGNVVDPLGLIDQYGADALRFFMAAMESQGRDIKMDEKRVEGYRNFATKLWNATRFCQANGIGASTTLAAPEAALAVNKWIIGEVVETLEALDKAMAELRFDAAANTIYHFVWDRFCDWYLELIKGQIDDETKAVAGWVLDQILVMLHPFMPFITEELWHAQGERRYELILAKWPKPRETADAAAKAEVEWLIDFVNEMRSSRSELQVPPSSLTEIFVINDIHFDGFRTAQGERYDLVDRFRTYGPAIARLTRSDIVQFIMTGTAFDLRTRKDIDRREYSTAKSRGFTIVVGGATYHIPLEGVIDFDAANERLEKALEASTKEAKSLEGRLNNPAFVEKAKPEAVEKARADHAHHAAEAERLAAALARLG